LHARNPAARAASGASKKRTRSRRGRRLGQDGRQNTPVEVTAYTNRPSDCRSRAWTASHKADSVDANCSADRFVKVFMPTGWNDEPAGRYPLLAIELYRAPGDLRKPSWYAAP